MARLGLRSAEVARLKLDDIDWRAGEIVVRGKARRVDRLPLPDEVGHALVAWLEARPAVESRRVFLTVKAPVGPIRPDRVTGIARLACGRAGVAQVGAHRLRHALAMEMQVSDVAPAASFDRVRDRCATRDAGLDGLAPTG